MFVGVGLLIMLTGAELIPSTNAIHGLRARTSSTLNIAVSVWASVSIVSSSSANNVSAALLVLVCLVIMYANTIIIPSSQAVHWLGAALSGALLVSIGIEASKTIVSSVNSDGIGSASLVLVLTCVMLAIRVGSPCSSTINRLGTSLLGALNLLVLKWTLLAVQVSLGGNLVGSALLILVTSSNVLAARVRIPSTLAINRLTASRLGAVGATILIWTSKAIVGRSLADAVHAATLVLVVLLVIVARVVDTPRSNTVNRLSALLSGALLKLISVWTAISIVGRSNRNLVGSASLVLASVLVMSAGRVHIPSSDTVHWLRALVSFALLKLVLKRTSKSIMQSTD